MFFMIMYWYDYFQVIGKAAGGGHILIIDVFYNLFEYTRQMETSLTLCLPVESIGFLHMCDLRDPLRNPVGSENISWSPTMCHSLQLPYSVHGPTPCQILWPQCNVPVPVYIWENWKLWELPWPSGWGRRQSAWTPDTPGSEFGDFQLCFENGINKRRQHMNQPVSANPSKARESRTGKLGTRTRGKL